MTNRAERLAAAWLAADFQSDEEARKALLALAEPGDDNPHPTDDGPKYPDPDKRSAHLDPDDGLPEPWPPEGARQLVRHPAMCATCGRAFLTSGAARCAACLMRFACLGCGAPGVASYCDACVEWEEAGIVHEGLLAISR